VIASLLKLAHIPSTIPKPTTKRTSTEVPWFGGLKGREQRTKNENENTNLIQYYFFFSAFSWGQRKKKRL